MNEQLMELVRALTDLAPQIWAATLRQVRVECVMGSIWCVGFFLAAALFIWAARTAWRKAGSDSLAWNEDKDDFTFAGWLSLCVAGLAVVFLLAFLRDVLTALLNPQWAAIQLWLKMIGG